MPYAPSEAYLYDRTTGISFEFGVITSIRDTYSVNLTQTAIVIYGYKNSMCMDLGVSKTYTLDFIRVNPMNPNNSSTTESTRWSNAYWIEKLKDALNRWQVDSDGFQFTFQLSQNMRDLYPSITRENVYVNQVSLPRTDSSSQYISGSIALQVGSLTLDSGPGDVPQVKMTFNAGFSGGDPASFSVSNPNDSYYIIPSPKSSWVEAQLKDMAIFKYWSCSAGVFYSGQRVLIGSDIRGNTNFTAMWETGTVYPYVDAGQYTHEISADTTEVLICVVGAGGGGDGGRMRGSQGDYVGGGGGAGGSSNYARYDVKGVPNPMQITVGEGGEKGTDSTDGKGGGDSYINGLPLRGYGGGGAVENNPGLAQYNGYDGGKGGYQSMIDERKQDPADGGGDYGGKTEPAHDGVNGGGGGSPGYDSINFILSAIGITPAGGDGGWHDSPTIGEWSAPGGAGKYGGGGGGGAVYNDPVIGLSAHTDGGNGGDGMVIIVEFRG